MSTIQQIAAAQPIAYVVVTSPNAPPVGAPAGWRDDGSTLTAPNGKMVRLGFREYVLTHPWSAENVPATGEFGDRGGSSPRVTGGQLHWEVHMVSGEAPPPPTP